MLSNAYPTLELGKELPDMPGNWSRSDS